MTYFHDCVGNIRYPRKIFCSSIVTRCVFCPHYHTLMRSKRCASHCVVGCDSPRFILVCPEGHSAGESHIAAVALQLALGFPTGARPKLLEPGKVISHSRAVAAVPPALRRFVAKMHKMGLLPVGGKTSSQQPQVTAGGGGAPWHLSSAPAPSRT